MYQVHSHSLRPLTTAHLAQTMSLLYLTAPELKQKIFAELAANPALELIEERRCPNCNRLLPNHGICPTCSRPNPNLPQEPIVFISPREDFYSGSGVSNNEYPDDNYAPVTEDLATYVLRQIATELESQDRALAAYLLTHLDDDGFLTVNLIEVARFHHVAVSRLEAIIHLIQRADPLGVGSSSPQEAMLVQLDVLAENHEIPPHTREAILEGISLLSRHQYTDLAQKLNISLQKVKDIAAFIGKNLNPYPGRCCWGDQRQPAPSPTEAYHQPDIIISNLNNRPDGPLVIEIIMPIAGTLQVSALFKQALRQASEDKIEAWKSDLDRASLFVKCLQQRNHTMQRLLHRIAHVQGNYIRKGESALVPLTRAQLAGELEVHESTISRAVANKSVQLPNGHIVPLAKFFDRSLNVRTVLRKIIDEEKKPLSDTELVKALEEYGHSVARRTVAKYRSMEGILPAHLRSPHLATT